MAGVRALLQQLLLNLDCEHGVQALLTPLPLRWPQTMGTLIIEISFVKWCDVCRETSMHVYVSVIPEVIDCCCFGACRFFMYCHMSDLASIAGLVIFQSFFRSKRQRSQSF